MAGVTQLEVNGTKHQVEGQPSRSLLEVLRDDLGLTGSKYGCGEGRCGACTVVIDGQPARSCITLLGTCASKRITTIEALERSGTLHPLQQAFLAEGALQCGYCTTGMIMSGVALLEHHESPSRDQIVDWMEGNICRCGTYARIVAAIQSAAGTMKGGVQ